MRQPAAGLLAAGAVLAFAALGARWRPDPNDLWYARLRKPPLRPPGAVIAPVWAVLDVTLASAGARLLAAPASPARLAALGTWATTITGLAAYPWLMFGQRRIGPGCLVVASMLATTVGTIRASTHIDRRAGLLLSPLASWLGFALYLQAGLWILNPGLRRPPR